MIGSGQLARSTVRNLFHYLLSRDVIIAPGTADDESELLTCLAEGFASGDYADAGCAMTEVAPQPHDLPTHVKVVVGLPQYRRVR